MQSLSGNAEKAVEMDALLKEAQKYAARYENEPGQQREGHAAEVSEAEPTGERREENHPDAEPEKRTEEPEQEETVRFTVSAIEISPFLPHGGISWFIAAFIV